MVLYKGMLEVLGIRSPVEIVEVPAAPELLTNAAIWMDDLFFFFHVKHVKHLPKPSRKDLKNKATVEL